MAHAGSRTGLPPMRPDGLTESHSLPLQPEAVVSPLRPNKVYARAPSTRVTSTPAHATGGRATSATGSWGHTARPAEPTPTRGPPRLSPGSVLSPDGLLLAPTVRGGAAEASGCDLGEAVGLGQKSGRLAGAFAKDTLPGAGPSSQDAGTRSLAAPPWNSAATGREGRRGADMAPRGQGAGESRSHGVPPPHLEQSGTSRARGKMALQNRPL